MFYSKDSNRILWIDWIKALAVIAVGIIHVCGGYLQDNLMFSYNWYVAIFFESFCRYAVVFFVMASGFLILRKNEPITNVPRRFKRIMVPFVFWMFIYAIFYYFVIDHKPLDVGNFLIYYLNGFLDPTSVCLLFWFVYMILGLYVFAPILSKWIHNSKIVEIEYFLVVWVIIMLLRFVGVDSIIPDYFRYFSGAIGYFVLGYYLTIKKSKYLESRRFGFLLFMIGSLMGVIGSIVVPMFTGTQTFMFMSVGDITPNACLQAIGLFIMVKNTDFNRLSDRTNSLIVLLSLESYGFYLSHLLVVGLLNKLSIFSIENNALIVIPIFAIVVLIVTNLMIYIMSKIPFLKRFTGFKSIL